MPKDNGRPSDRPWVEEVELGDVMVKWGWSHFSGLRDEFHEDGEYDFTITLPEDTAIELRDLGWTSVKPNEPREEGDPIEWTMQIKLSDRFDLPAVYFIKGNRRIRMKNMRELADIRRGTCKKLSVVITPSPWSRPDGKSGVTAYAKEMWVEVNESRFSAAYADLEEID